MVYSCVYMLCYTCYESYSGTCVPEPQPHHNHRSQHEGVRSTKVPVYPDTCVLTAVRFPQSPLGLGPCRPKWVSIHVLYPVPSTTFWPPSPFIHLFPRSLLSPPPPVLSPPLPVLSLPLPVLSPPLSVLPPPLLPPPPLHFPILFVFSLINPT